MNPSVTTEYRFVLVALSFALAFVGSLIALMITRHVRQRNGEVKMGAAITAGIALGGIGVWSMHFIGMLALKMDVSSGFGMIENAISLAAAITCTSAALIIVSKDPGNKTRVLGGGLLLGLGVAVMHYLGMYGMRIGGYITWDWTMIAISVLIAVVAGTVALWLAFNTADMTSRIAASTVMAAAVCAMHYTGMGAAEFICTTPNRFATVQGWDVIGSQGLGAMVGVGAFAMAVLISMDLYLQWLQRSTRVNRNSAG